MSDMSPEEIAWAFDNSPAAEPTTYHEVPAWEPPQVPAPAPVPTPPLSDHDLAACKRELGSSEERLKHAIHANQQRLAVSLKQQQAYRALRRQAAPENLSGPAVFSSRRGYFVGFVVGAVVASAVIWGILKR